MVVDRPWLNVSPQIKKHKKEKNAMEKPKHLDSQPNPSTSLRNVLLGNRHDRVLQQMQNLLTSTTVHVRPRKHQNIDDRGCFWGKFI